MRSTTPPTGSGNPHPHPTPPAATQVPAGNFSYVQYGLGSPMVVQGVRLVAPEGECSTGSEDCSDRILNSFIYVGNAS